MKLQREVYALNDKREEMLDEMVKLKEQRDTIQGELADRGTPIMYDIKNLSDLIERLETMRNEQDIYITFESIGGGYTEFNVSLCVNNDYYKKALGKYIL